MIDVVLVRHAIAFERDPQRWRDDRVRPLTTEGIRKFRKAARGIAHWVGPVERVLTSPLVRTRQTAEILTQTAGWPEAIDCPALEPGTSPKKLIPVLRDQAFASLALVGHEPNLGELIGACCAGANARLALQMKKGGIACIRFAGALRAGQGELLWLVPPRLLRALG